MTNITFDALIEIPKGSKNKYEFDKELNAMRFDRCLHTSMQYPADYGYVPNTLALDGDAMDVLVLFSEPTFPGCVVEVKPVGVFYMTDDKGKDEKVLCVPVSDPIWNKIDKLSDVNPHILNEIEHFFQVYKDLENKKVETDGWGDEKEAVQMYNQCKERYKG